MTIGSPQALLVGELRERDRQRGRSAGGPRGVGTVDMAACLLSISWLAPSESRVATGVVDGR